MATLSQGESYCITLDPYDSITVANADVYGPTGKTTVTTATTFGPYAASAFIRIVGGSSCTYTFSNGGSPDPTGIIQNGAAAVAAAIETKPADVVPRTVSASMHSMPTKKSALAMIPAVTSSTASGTLGPTAQANSVSEYNTLKSNRLEIDLSTPALFQSNGSNLSTPGVVGYQLSASGQTTLVSAPWPQSNGSMWWWARGGIAFYVDGADRVDVSYILNATNACSCFVDGQALPGANAAGKLTNAVASTANNRQWLSVLLPDRYGHVVYFPYLTNIKSLVVPNGANIRPINFAGKALIFGDSVAGRFAGTQSDGTTPEVPLMHRELASLALEALGYDVTNAYTGGTGFFANGGGIASQKGSYSDYLDYFANASATITGWDSSQYTTVVLFGSGNDGGASPSIAKYVAVIQKALANFTNLRDLIITSVYEGFNTTSAARSLNDMLYAAIQQVNDSRVRWVPIDSHYNAKGMAMFSGTGNTGAAANDGNADFFLSNYGTDLRHPNAVGCLHGSNFVALELMRSGMRRLT